MTTNENKTVSGNMEMQQDANFRPTEEHAMKMSSNFASLDCGKETQLEMQEKPIEVAETADDATEEEAEEAVEFDDLPVRDDCWHRLFSRMAFSEGNSARRQRVRVVAKWAAAAVVGAAYLAYLVYCTYLLATRFRGTPEAEQSVRLLWVSAAAAAIAGVHWAPRCCGPAVQRLAAAWRHLRSGCARRLRPAAAYWWIPEVCVVAAFLLWMGVQNPANLVSASGLALMLALALLCSAHPTRVNWKPVLGGIVIQLVFAALILRTSAGFAFFNFLGDRTAEFMNHCKKGSEFLFGTSYYQHYFAFGVLPIVVYFSSILTVLFHLGVLQGIIQKIGAVMQVFLGTTAAESMVASANIFVGQTEAPLMIRPFLKLMTKSEIHSVMTSGLATIAGGVMAAYIGMGIPARHLLSASVMSAPAALAVSKLLYPETQVSRTRAEDLQKLQLARYGSVVEAAGMGAIASLAVVGAIAANLISFISILAFVNATITWLGYRAGLDFPLTFEFIVSYLFWPLTLVMGVAPRDCRQVAELIGVKTFLNEFVAYERLGNLKNNYKLLAAAIGNGTEPAYSFVGSDVFFPALNLTLSGGVLFEDRSMVIATYSLCGFSNLGSIGILMGALIAMAPVRRADIAHCAPRALLAGSLACFMTACIAGLFFTDADLVLKI